MTMHLGTKCVLCFLLFFQFLVSVLEVSGNTVPAIRSAAAGKCLSSPGADESKTLESNGKCICKRNVRGNDCSRCKKNAFHLSDSHVDGCLKCFCSGRSKNCSSSDLRREQVEYTFDEHNQGFEVVSRNLSLVNGSPKIDETNREIFITQLPVDSEQTYYWKLPNAFLGDKLTSYGGNLTFDLSYKVPSTERSRWNKDPLVTIKGNGIEMHFKEILKVKSRSQQTILLNEELWSKSRSKRRKKKPSRTARSDDERKKKKKKRRKKKKKSIKRKHMMTILSNVEYILIKANYRRHADEVRLRSVSLTQSIENGLSETIAEEVEKCDCPPEYSGLSCQQCASGFTKKVIPGKKKGGLTSFECVPCDCNGNSNLCHPDTGECFSCENGTSGSQCEKPSLYCDQRGKMYRGDLDCICKPRVEGDSCEKCKQGFFHLSFNNEHGCKTCWCNGVTSICEPSRLYRSEISLFSESSYVSIALVLGDGRTILSPVALKNTRAEFYKGPFEMTHWSLPKKFTGNLLRSYGGDLKFTIYNSGFCSDSEDTRLIVELVDYQRRSFIWKFKEEIDLNEPSTFFVPLQEEQFLYMNSQIQRNYFMKLLSFVREIKISIPKCSRLHYASIKDISLTTAVPYDTGQPQAVEVEHCLCPPQYSGLSCETCAPGYIRDSYTRRCIRKSFVRP